MKGQGSKIPDHMVRGARINDPIRIMTRIRVMDCSVGIGVVKVKRGAWVRVRGREASAKVDRELHC